MAPGLTPMEVRAAVTAALREIAPDVEADALDDADRLRQDLDLDSLDFLRLIERIAETTGVDVPERDYPQAATYGGLVAYIAARQR
ncbi:phosphopantetheine-binding protein [Sinomonas halotolerans]|uniref:Phosphopantetheine-binding protein n=1 Tax=Sinomonas halotolerans TaxID=1644133 RepID=A0ABU9WZK8_9MICC